MEADWISHTDPPHTPVPPPCRHYFSFVRPPPASLLRPLPAEDLLSPPPFTLSAVFTRGGGFMGMLMGDIPPSSRRRPGRPGPPPLCRGSSFHGGFISRPLPDYERPDDPFRSLGVPGTRLSFAGCALVAGGLTPLR